MGITKTVNIVTRHKISTDRWIFFSNNIYQFTPWIREYPNVQLNGYCSDSGIAWNVIEIYHG